MKKKKESAAAVTARSRRFRQRKLNRDRAANEVFYRDLLQKFFLARELSEADWAVTEEFYTEMLAPLIDRESFLGSLRHLDSVLETSAVHIGGEQIKVIKPRYFLKDETDGK